MKEKNIIGQKIVYNTISYFCKKLLLVIKPAFIWSKFVYTLLIYFIYFMYFMKCWFIRNVENLWYFFQDSLMNKKLNKYSIYLKYNVYGLKNHRL